MRRLLTGLLAMALLLGACGDDDAGDDSAVTSIPDETATSSTTTEPPVPPIDVIPSDPSLITEEYVEQVLDALYEVSLEAIELARAEGVVDQPSIDRLEATTTEEMAVQRINDLIALAGSGFPGIRETPEPMTFMVVDLLESSVRCIFVEVEIDSSGYLLQSSDPEGARDFVRLRPATEEQRRTGMNPTAWAVDQFPVTLDGSVPEERCAA